MYFFVPLCALRVFVVQKVAGCRLFEKHTILFDNDKIWQPPVDTFARRCR
jgi:hypothetical protein